MRYPLKEQLGDLFFKDLPKSPGVYLMYDRLDQLVYVGKAKNIRARLQSYRRIHVESEVSRKVLRLIKSVRKITWQICQSEKEALLLENKLLRTHKPRYNVVNTKPESYYFIGIQKNAQGFTLKLSTQNKSSKSTEFYGAFKGRRSVRRAFAALLRLSWLICCYQHNSKAHDDFKVWPYKLIQKKTAYKYDFVWNSQVLDKDRNLFYTRIQKYLRGTSHQLLSSAILQILEKGHLSPLNELQLKADFQDLKLFYQFGPQRNKRMLKALKGKSAAKQYGKIDQNSLDDLFVQYRFRDSL